MIPSALARLTNVNIISIAFLLPPCEQALATGDVPVSAILQGRGPRYGGSTCAPPRTGCRLSDRIGGATTSGAGTAGGGAAISRGASGGGAVSTMITTSSFGCVVVHPTR